MSAHRLKRDLEAAAKRLQRVCNARYPTTSNDQKLAVEAVIGEPVSVRLFPCSTGRYREIRRFPARDDQGAPPFGRKFNCLRTEFPSCQSRENFWANREPQGANSERAARLLHVNRRGILIPFGAMNSNPGCAGHCRHGLVHSPTIGFDLLYAFVIVRLGRRDLVWINVTTNPTAEWIARQITEAFPWMMPRNTSFAIVIGSTAPSSHADCAPWAFGTSLPHQPRLGRMALPNG